jgi:four helix bundle protein
MATISSFEDLKVWQLARELAREIYSLTSKGSFAKDFELKNQINKSAGSIMDNIAEGFERGGNKEFSQFLSISKGSCGEVRSQLYRALDRNHVPENELESAKNKALEVSRQLAGFITYLKNSDMRGVKYAKEPESNYGLGNFES